MEYKVIQTYNDYVSAHIAMGRLKEDGIECWLKDENTVTIDPILTNAIGGIKLMANSELAEKAIEILQKIERETKALRPCPKCGSHNVDYVSTPRKSSNWASAIIGFFITSYAIPVEKVYHCFDCGNEYNPEEKAEESND